MLQVWILLSVLTITFARPNPVDLKNVITVPPNCPSGQEWINGQCRDVWLRSLSTPAAPINAAVLDNDNNKVKIIDQNENLTSVKNIISVPSQCPIGYKPDALGICRKVVDTIVH